MDSLGGGDVSSRDGELEIGATSAQAHMKVRSQGPKAITTLVLHINADELHKEQKGGRIGDRRGCPRPQAGGSRRLERTALLVFSLPP